MVRILKRPVFDALNYDPHPGQEPVHRSMARHRVVCAGRRLGKSVIGGHELTLEALKTKGMTQLLHDERRRREFWIVGPEYSDAEKEFRILYNDLEYLGAAEYFDKPGTYNNPESGQMVISMFDGKFLVHAKSAKYPQTLVGEGLSGVILAEAAKLKRTVWTKYLRPTLADYRGWSLWSSTPEGRNHFHEAWKRGNDSAQPEWESWRMPSWVNPIVFPDGIDDAEVAEMRAEMSEERFNQEVGAEFTDFVGQVFKEFDEEIHVGDYPFNPDLPLYLATDYGWTNPFVCLFIQMDAWDNVYVVGEYRVTHRDINDIANDLKAIPAVRHATMMYPEPAGPGETAVLEKALGVKVNTSTGGDLKWRLELIRQHLKPMPEHVPEHKRKPKLLIDKKCAGKTSMNQMESNLVQEMGDYRFPENKSEARSNPEAPLDKDDHGPEALGRFFRGHFGPPSQPAAKGRARVSRANVRR